MSANSESPLAGLGLSEDSDERVGTLLADRYRLESLLGEGGMGKVYQAEHVLMRKRLAVKILHRELTTVPEVVARFEREAMAAANIDHPNIAAATDFGKLADGAVFLVLEFVSGKNLRDEIAEGPLPPVRAAHIVRQIASALDAAHALAIVHRDLKPENVMLIERSGDPDFVKVLDFGVAKVPIGEGGRNRPGNPITKVGMVFGTPEYMAPEQALGQQVDGRADLYALGVIFYEMLSGVRPFSSKSPVGILGQQLSKPPPPLAERCPGVVVPASLEAVVMKLLAKEPSERFRSAGAVVQALEAVIGPSPARLTTGSGGMLAQPPPRALSIPDLVPPPPDEIELPQPPEPVASESIQELPASDWSGGEPESPPAIAQPSAPLQPSLARLGRMLDRTYAWADERRRSLPDRLRRPLQPLPTPALLWGSVASVLTGALLLVALVVVLATRSKPLPAPLEPPAGAASAAPVVAPVAASAPVSSVQPELAREIAEAKASGSPALIELAKKHDDNPRVLVELADSYMAQKKYKLAVEAIERLLAKDAAWAKETRVKNVIHAAAQMPQSADKAFSLLDGPMGHRGADVVYSLVVNKKILQPTRARADRWLAANFESKASPAVAIAYQLHRAKNCKQRHDLLPMVGEQGDSRALLLLRALEQTTGCGNAKAGDCNPCLREDDALASAISAIERRFPSAPK
jgi:eukaryotic-like serine/threonine-protein kinase